MLLAAVLVLETIYFASGDSLILWFSPQPLVWLVTFVGFLFGPMTGLLWGTLAGFCEEMALMGPAGIYGLTPLVYLWLGYLSGKIFHGRADGDNPAIGALLTVAAIIVSQISGSLLGMLFSTTCNLAAGPLTIGRAVAFVLQAGVLGPFALPLLKRLLGVRGYSS